MLERWVGGCGVDSVSSRYGSVTSCCECCDEPSDSSFTELVISVMTSGMIMELSYLIFCILQLLLCLD
jgi:hypothetical protein